MGQSRKQIPPPRRLRSPPPLAPVKPLAHVSPQTMAPLKWFPITAYVPYKPILPPSKPLNVVVPPQDKSKMFFAGCLAHEFLTEGTISGKLYDPTLAEVPPTPLACHDFVDKGNCKCIEPVPMLSLEPSNGNVNKGNEKVFELSSKPKLSKVNRQLVFEESYAEVSRELKNRRHIPGIVNPSQLVHFLDLHPEYK